MPVFEYVAIDSSGKTLKGSLDADSARAAKQKLKAKGLFPTSLKEGKEAGKEKTKDVLKYLKSDRVSLPQLAIATRQLSTLIAAGLPLVRALDALSDQTEAESLRRQLVEVKEKVEEGSSLAKALGQFPKAFPRLYINMVASGETSGTLDTVLDNLADHLEGQMAIRQKVTSALFYPILMLGFNALVVIGLLAFVVPSIVEIFQKQGAALPLPTQIMLALSHILVSYWYLLILMVFAVFAAAKHYYQTPNGKTKIDLWIMRIPVFGNVYLKVATARIASTLGILLKNGVQMLTALEIVKNIIGNVHLIKTIENAREGVREGRSLAKELKASGFFPPMLTHMIAIGETSGHLEEMLNRAGKAYEREVNATLSGLTSLIEPLMMIVIGCIVFAIVISVLLPMVDLVNIVQK